MICISRADGSCLQVLIKEANEKGSKKCKRLEELLKLFPIAVIFQCKLGNIIKSRGNNIRKCFPFLVTFFPFLPLVQKVDFDQLEMNFASVPTGE